MARNKISDLRDHLFAQLEKLSDDELMAKPEAAAKEIERTTAIVEVSKAIVETGKLEHSFLKLRASHDVDVVSDFIPQKELKA